MRAALINKSPGRPGRTRACRGPGTALLRSPLIVLVLPCLVACGGASDGSKAPVLKPTDAAYLEAVVLELSRTLPSKINKYTEIMSVKAVPQGLRYNIRMIHMPAHTVDHNTLKSAKLQIAERSCGDDKERLDMDAGVAMHYVVHGMEARSAGRFFVSDVFCEARGW